MFVRAHASPRRGLQRLGLLTLWSALFALAGCLDYGALSSGHSDGAIDQATPGGDLATLGADLAGVDLAMSDSSSAFPVQLVSFSTSAGQGMVTAHTMTSPSNVQAGDMVLLTLSYLGNGSDFSDVMVNGMTGTWSTMGSFSDGGGHSTKWFFRFADAVDMSSPSYQAQFNTAVTCNMLAVAYRGASRLIQQIPPGSYMTTSLGIDTVTTESNELVIALVGYSSGAVTWTISGGFTNAAQGNGAMVYDLPVANAGPVTIPMPQASGVGGFDLEVVYLTP